MAIVLDASAALAWCFRDEETPESERLLAMAKDGERLYVPAHWPVEILNGLGRAVRRGRLQDTNLDAFLEQLQEYDIAIDLQPMAQLWDETLPLVRLYGLSAYDAAYLALAIRLKISLATSEEKLRTAATLEQIPIAI